MRRGAGRTGANDQPRRDCNVSDVTGCPSALVAMSALRSAAEAPKRSMLSQERRFDDHLEGLRCDA